MVESTEQQLSPHQLSQFVDEIEAKKINFDSEFEGLVWPEVNVFDLDRYQNG